MDSWSFLPFFFPARGDSVDCGSGRDEESSGENVLRLIQIRLTTSSLEKTRQFVKPIRRKPESPIRVPETQSAFIRTQNEPLSVVAMRVCNPDRSPVGINR
jgi:hypothetical protein